MPNSQIETNDLESQQRIQETKVSKTTTGPGETSVKSGNTSDSKLESNADSQKNGANPDTSATSGTSKADAQAEPGDLNEV